MIKSDILKHFPFHACKVQDFVISEASHFCLSDQVCSDLFSLQSLLHDYYSVDFVQEPAVNLSQFEYLIDSFQSSSEKLCDAENSFIVALKHLIQQLVVVQTGNVRSSQSRSLDFQRCNGLKQSTFKVSVNGHDFAGCLHLSSELS